MTGGLSIIGSSMRLVCTPRERECISAELVDMVTAASAELEALPIEGTHALHALVELLAGGVMLQAEAQARNVGARQ